MALPFTQHREVHVALAVEDLLLCQRRIEIIHAKTERPEARFLRAPTPVVRQRGDVCDEAQVVGGRDRTREIVGVFRVVTATEDIESR